MICILVALLMLGLFAVALKLPLLIAIIHGNLPDPHEVALERSKMHAQTPSTLKPVPKRETPASTITSTDVPSLSYSPRIA
ncbi:MAG: hypothetical protein ACI8T1_000756 [Verrucomicrobiales bacterium]|jgi:hypothetical protein